MGQDRVLHREHEAGQAPDRGRGHQGHWQPEAEVQAGDWPGLLLIDDPELAMFTAQTNTLASKKPFGP